MHKNKTNAKIIVYNNLGVDIMLKAVLSRKNLSENELFKNWHTQRYLKQCVYNLQEKFDCGGISGEEWKKIKTLKI